MRNQELVLAYVESCTSGTLAAADCGPIWQLLVIGTLLVISVATLLLLQLRRRYPSSNA